MSKSCVQPGFFYSYAALKILCATRFPLMIVCDVEILAHLLMLLNVKRQLCCYGIPAVVKKTKQKKKHTL